MVSIDDKVTYQTRINESPKLTAFYNLLLGKTLPIIANENLKELDEIYFGLLTAIQSNDKAIFEKHYDKKKKSKPSKESPSPFVNDDFLIFSLIIGILKFNLDRSWIKYIISLRNRNPITITLENILNENYYSKSNLPEITLMYFHLNNQSLISNDFLTTTFKSINDNTSLFYIKSDFQILCSLRSYDLIIELKESIDGFEINSLKNFQTQFLKRIKILSWIVQTTLIILVLFLTIKLISYNPAIKAFFDKIGSVLKIFGLIGISQLGNVFPIIKRNLYTIMLRIFGYPKDLIKKESKSESEK